MKLILFQLNYFICIANCVEQLNIQIGLLTVIISPSSISSHTSYHDLFAKSSIACSAPTNFCAIVVCVLVMVFCLIFFFVRVIRLAFIQMNATRVFVCETIFCSNSTFGQNVRMRIYQCI